MLPGDICVVGVVKDLVGLEKSLGEFEVKKFLNEGAFGLFGDQGVVNPVFEDAVVDLHGVVALKGEFFSRELVQEHPEGPPVGLEGVALLLT